VVQTKNHVLLFDTGAKYPSGFNLIFKMSVALHGKQAQEATVLIDTTVQEKNGF
jgi:hypothetical protein